jgi:predicted kinase
MLDNLGYESKMIYVSASLDNAQKRNASRARKLPQEIVKQDWDNAQKNAQSLKRIFGRDYIEVTNDDDLKSLQTKATKLYAKLMTWTTSFPSNKPALKWKDQELQFKKS